MGGSNGDSFLLFLSDSEELENVNYQEINRTSLEPSTSQLPITNPKSEQLLLFENSSTDLTDEELFEEILKSKRIFQGHQDVDDSAHCSYTVQHEQQLPTQSNDTFTASDDDPRKYIENPFDYNGKIQKGLYEPKCCDATVNDNLTMSGRAYLGCSNESSSNKQNAPKPPKKLKPTCNSNYCKLYYHCSEFTQEYRQHLFDSYSDLKLAQKKMFVGNSTKRNIVRNINVSSKKCISTQYYFKKDDMDLRVCKKMYLTTLGVSEWLVRKWINDFGSGMSAQKWTNEIEKRERLDKRRLSRELLQEFIENLPKVPSIYCQTNTCKIHLEPEPEEKLAEYNTYMKACHAKGLPPLLPSMFNKIIHKTFLEQSKNDLCDICVSHLTNRITREYDDRQTRRNYVEVEKNKDLNQAMNGKCVVLMPDVQVIKNFPNIKLRGTSYQGELFIYNFTIYEHPSKKVKCYWFTEVEGDTQSSVYTSCLIDYLNDLISEFDAIRLPIIVWSDGCTHQNRNVVLANALLNISVARNVKIYQKYLEPGDVLMEVKNVHKAIKLSAKKYGTIYVPNEYLEITHIAREDPFPYEAISVNYKFFKNYNDPKVMVFRSIRPGNLKGEARVIDIKSLQYRPDGNILSKTSFADQNYTLLPRTPRDITLPVTRYKRLLKNQLKLTSAKFNDLQDLKMVIPVPYHSFYDNLPHHEI